MTQTEYIDSIRTQYGTIILSKKDTAKELGISVNGLDNLRNDGKIKFINIGNRVKFKANDIATFMKMD